MKAALPKDAIWIAHRVGREVYRVVIITGPVKGVDGLGETFFSAAVSATFRTWDGEA